MKNFWVQIEKPFLALAPMAGYTDQPFRLICKEFGADVLYSEMISSEALFHNAISHRLQIGYTSEVKEVLHLGGVLKALKIIQFSQAEQPFVIQIFGADPEHLALAAEYISSGQWARDLTRNSKLPPATPERSDGGRGKSQNYNVASRRQTKLETRSKFEDLKIDNLIRLGSNANSKQVKIENWKLEFTSIPAGIDVNMGCPAKDMVKTGAGAALLKNPKLAEKIIKTIKKKVKNIPLSVKTRIGWSDNKNTLIFCRMLECCGVDAIAIHGRIYQQGFSGNVDWETIYKVKKALKIPVIGNGGININSKLKTKNEKLFLNPFYSKPTDLEQLKTKSYQLTDNNFCLDGYMIGQGALGRPWIFEKLKTKNTSFDIAQDALNTIEWAKRKTEESLSDNYNNINFIKKTVLGHAELVEKLKGQQGIIEFRKHLCWYTKGFANASNLRSQLVKIKTFKNIEDALELFS